MDGNFGLPLIIPCKPSRGMATLSAVLHAGAALAVLVSAISAPVKICIVAGIAAAGILRLSRAGLVRGDAARHLLLTARDEWRLVAADGGVEELVPVWPAFVHPGLVILHFASGTGARRVFVLTPDNSSQETLRRLRVRLRFPIRKP